MGDYFAEMIALKSVIRCSLISHLISFSLTAVGYLCYLPNVHRLVAENPDMPFQEELLRLNPQCLSLLILFTFIAAMMVKVSGK